MARCPRCGSNYIKIQGYMGIKVIKCKKCGFDESSTYEVYPEQKTSQKAKSKYTPYKIGGSRRTIIGKNK